jgi:aryl-alcohol dehydrogenase-like predicted oxidoreductase
MAATANLAGFSVNRIGFGTMQLPGHGVFGPPRDREAALAVLKRAVELGVNHIDTAQYYGPDVSNELIHTALHPYPENLVLVSKVGGARDASGGWHAAQRPEQLRAGVEANLSSLEVERVHVVNLRLMNEGADVHGAQRVTFDDQLAEMVALRDEGKIGGIGLSNVSTDQVRHARTSTSIACVQNAYNLLRRDDQETLKLCAEHGLAYVPFFPLGSASGWLPRVTDDPVVQDVAGEVGATPAQVGLAWLLAHDPSILLIPGTSSIDHLEENTAAADVTLTSEQMTRLEAERGSGAA